MNENIIVRFFHEGEPLEITAASHVDGIVFAEETSAYPIKGSVTLIPADNDISRFHLDRIRQAEDWQPPTFFVAIARDRDTLRLSGGGTRQPEKNLPPIGYHLVAQMHDVRFHVSETDFVLKEGESKELRVDILEPKRFKFVQNVTSIDDETRRILESPASQLDGISLLDWFKRSVVRSARKVCLLNCLAKLRALPTPTMTLSRHLRSVIFADIDRIAVTVAPEFFSDLLALSTTGNPVFRRDSGPLHATHQTLKRRLLGENAEHYDLVSFRENVGHVSMQIIVATPKRTIPRPLCYAEVDIDLFNPFIDAISFGGHIGELVDSGKTDHFELVNKVPGDFRYYSLG